MKKPIEKFNEFLFNKISVELATGQEVKSASESVKTNIRVVEAIVADYLKLKTQFDNNGKMLITNIYEKTANDYAEKAKQLGLDANENPNYKILLEEIKKGKDLHSKVAKYFL
jgi:hypothetical protein